MSDSELSHQDGSFVETLIIGGGLAGLTCGRVLAEAGREFRILEATDRVGGRVRSDVVDGFTLDHGFQVLLTSYPACRRWLDYDALRLQPFEPGALIRQNGRFCVLSDPWRRPLQTLATATNPVGSLGDKLRIARLRRASRRGSLDDLYTRPQTSSLDRLRADGFSERMIDQFFRPFLGGVFLDETLGVSSRMLEFVFRMFAGGDIALPADGMAAIPRQLAEKLPRGAVEFGKTVRSIAEVSIGGRARHRVELSDGSVRTCRDLVIATPRDAAEKLLGEEPVAAAWSGTTNLYYAADQSPDSRRLLMLRGDESGPIQTAVVLSDVARSYAPAGKALVSVSVDGSDEPADGLDDAGLDERVRVQLRDWFGESSHAWELLRIHRVPYALPVMDFDPVLCSPAASVRAGATDGAGQSRAGVWIAGDHVETPSIQGAMNSGQRAGEAILLA